jgi:tetratricopeptide (TPR) repeat protein
LALYQDAWDQACARGDHFHAMVIAHTAGAAEPDPEKKHGWNVAALSDAEAISDLVRERGMFPSLFNNLGISYNLRGERTQARQCFERALSHLAEVRPEAQATRMRRAIERNLARLD